MISPSGSFLDVGLNGAFFDVVQARLGDITDPPTGTDQTAAASTHTKGVSRKQK